MKICGLPRPSTTPTSIARRRPCVSGHPVDDTPSYGIVTRLIANGSRLFAEVANVSASLKDWVRTGRFKKISASFLMPRSPGNPAPGSWYLKHVGFLGSMAPVVKGMADPAFAEFSGGIVCFSNDTHTMPADIHTAITIELSEAPAGYAWDASKVQLHGRIAAVQKASGLPYPDCAMMVIKDSAAEVAY